MAIFSPEKLINNLISSLGVSPQDFVAFIQMARDEFAAMRADRLAFKPASIRVVQDMTARMDRIEAKLDTALNMIGAKPLLNGVYHHERNDLNGD